MRKLLWGGAAALLLGAAGLYGLPHPVRHVALAPAPAAEAEEQEARALPRGPASVDPLFEPIVVERTEVETEYRDILVNVQEASTGSFLQVAFVGQPPRPDAQAGERRMPYADEEVVMLPEWVSAPVAQLMECLGKLQCLVSAVSVPGAAEEAEMKDVPQSGPEPPLSEPLVPLPAMDYHHHHSSCPYTGRCPAPYPPRYVPPYEPK